METRDIMISKVSLLMAQFIVRNLEDDIHQKLRDMAQSHDQSLEEFVRELLRNSPPSRGATRPHQVRVAPTSGC